jgi:hypothetical protein
MTLPIPAADYDAFLRAIKARIQTARHQAVLAVNRELVLLYWRIGHEIATRQHAQGWGQRSSTGSPPICVWHSPT